ncbi:hypothetical protein FIBSPDRAFT_928237 [Athelia psychrophila]|uniref:Uncharacterized protein n=1 Tax=Athelia psychrophila TaxID=1759441 RepID=A0A166QEM8_9AGAM|nr:hypothetical protein FIBSPDRAFT_928237 [Fibularhizoctonia sp. CBS 109695]
MACPIQQTADRSPNPPTETEAADATSSSRADPDAAQRAYQRHLSINWPLHCEMGHLARARSAVTWFLTPECIALHARVECDQHSTISRAAGTRDGSVRKKTAVYGCSRTDLSSESRRERRVRRHPQTAGQGQAGETVQAYAEPVRL